MNTPTLLPDEATAARIFQAHSAEPISRVTRFPTGMCHHVYEIVTTSAQRYVVRIAAPAAREYLVGGLYWHPRLKAIGVPVPALHASGLEDPFAYMLLARLPGTDLGQVIGGLSAAAKQALASAIVEVQQAVGSLPRARRFGFAFSYAQAQTTGQASWAAVVRAEIARSEARIRQVGRIDPRLGERVRALVARHAPYLDCVAPVPFLDDMTTKNVIVHEGKLSGIVDTDAVCFGDPLFTVGLTQMALLSLGVDTGYIAAWLEAMQATSAQRAIVPVYTLVFCLDFMGELGTMFSQPIPFSAERAAQLREIFEHLAGAQRV